MFFQPKKSGTLFFRPALAGQEKETISVFNHRNRFHLRYISGSDSCIHSFGSFDPIERRGFFGPSGLHTSPLIYFSSPAITPRKRGFCFLPVTKKM
jgi:hypothetical protein